MNSFEKSFPLFRKKLRDIEALEAKLASGEISAPEPEQLEKVGFCICICIYICICIWARTIGEGQILHIFATLTALLGKVVFPQVSRKTDVMEEIAALEKMVA